MEYRVYVVHPEYGPQLEGWCDTEHEAAQLAEALEDEGKLVEVKLAL